MINLSEFEISLSYECNTNCALCYANASKKYDEVIDKKIAFDSINYVSRNYQLQTLGLLGGEPTLHYQLLLDIISEAKKNQIPNIMLFTNGEWGGNKINVERMCKDLKRVGLTEIIISVDYFHQKTIPIQYCINIAFMALSIGLRVRFSMCVFEDINSNNEFDSTNRSIFQIIKTNLNLPINIQKMRFFGRANNLSSFSRKLYSANDVNHPCREKEFFGSLNKPKGFLIDNFGYIQICDGISIGNIYKKSLQEILNDYSSEKNPIINLLWEYGPLGLAKYLKNLDLDMNKKIFVNNCHLCYNMRKLIQENFTEILFPKIFY